MRIDRALRAKTDAAPQGRARARLAADAGRQGVFDRYRHRGRLARRAGAWRHGLHRGDGRRAALSRCAHRRDLRRHQRHPGHRPRRRARCRSTAARRSRSISTNCARTVEAVRSKQRPPSARSRRALGEAVDSLERATRWLLAQKSSDDGARRRDALSAPVRAAQRRLHARRGGARGLACAPATETHRRASHSRASSPRTSLSRRGGLERSGHRRRRQHHRRRKPRCADIRTVCMSLKGKTLFITGASRGIGLAIALRARAKAPMSPSPPRPPSRIPSSRARSTPPRRRSSQGRRQGAAARRRRARRGGRAGRDRRGRRRNSAASTSS